MDQSRVVSAVAIAFIGLVIPGILVIVLGWHVEWKASEISTLAGAFTSIVGTLVGAFLGVHVGEAGKEKAEAVAQRALAALPDDSARMRAMKP